MELGIIFLEALRFFNSSSREAHTETDVPQRSRKLCNQTVCCLLCRLILEEKEDIEIRVGKEELPPVSTDCDQSDTSLGRGATQTVKEL